MSVKDNLKVALKGSWLRIKRAHCFLEKHAWLQCSVIGVLLNFIIESLHRHSAFEGFLHIIESPLPFLFNALMIATVFSICTLFKHRYFAFLLVGCTWLAFGIANSVLLTMRITPLEWADLQVVKLSIIQIYLSLPVIIFVMLLILSAIAFLVFFFIKGPKTTVNYIKNAISSMIFIVVLILSVYIFRSNGILLSDHVKNLANAYKDYGFNYCFMCSMLDLGIDKPSQYDEQDVQKIVQQINKAAEDNSSENEGEDPNIIFLQLETFFDVNHLSNVTFSENPIPVFSELQKKYSSGYIAVPSIGAGTANTEFEVVSGLSLEYFGVGEYPYKTILKKHPSESICRNLAERGYKSHAIHNNTAVFYDRNIVFGNLGFDTFTSMEYMHDLEFTETGWAKDGVLIGCITDCLDSSEGSDLVYTITVQSHGKYPSEYSTQTKIEISGIEDDITRNSFEYYVNQLNEVDSVIGRLLEELEKRDEKTVVVMFGDHLPSFDISEQDLQSDDLFQTEYVIWDNFGMEKRDGTYEAYQLSSHIMELLGFDNGLINKLHQNFKQNEKYQQWLEILEYDMLYGKKYAFGGEENFLYKTTELKMGVLDVVVNDVTYDNAERKVFITGENFNKYSTVFINNRKISTTYIGRTNLVANGVELQVGDMITVEQVDVESNRLSSSLTYIIGGTTDSPNILAGSNNIIYRKRELKTSTTIAIIALSSAILAVTVLLILVITKRKKH